MSINWWRFYHGAWRDEKIVVATRRADETPCNAIAFLVTILDFASQNTPRGSVDGFDLELISEYLGLTTASTSRLWYELGQVGFFDKDRIKNWEKYNPSRERPDDHSTERVRAFRARHTPSAKNETPRNATKRLDKSRGDKRREDIDSSSRNSGNGVFRNGNGRCGELDKAFDNWNTVADGLGLPAVRDRTTARKRKLSARLKDGGIQEWNSVLESLADQPFLHGNNERQWKATFDWFVSPTNFTKVKEKTYAKE